MACILMASSEPSIYASPKGSTTTVPFRSPEFEISKGSSCSTCRCRPYLRPSTNSLPARFGASCCTLHLFGRASPICFRKTSVPDGDILVVSFHIQGRTAVFNPAGARLVNARSVSNLSGAYFDRRFWIGLNAVHSELPGVVKTLFNDLDNWGGFEALPNAPQAADPPTFLYDPLDDELEAAVVFTRHAAVVGW